MTDEGAPNYWRVVIEPPDELTAAKAKDIENMINIEFGQFVKWRAKAYKTRLGKLLFDDVVLWAETHQREHPSHGANCICADKMIGDVRKAITLPTNEFQEPLAQRRVDWILQTALRRY